MGWNDVGWRSSDLPNATTFMNELAQKSVLMTQYYSQPSCTPSRATIMTGKWAHKTGFQNYELHVSDPVGVPLSSKLMPEYMAELGYKSHMVGKWNIGHCNSKYLPHERGFEEFLGYMGPGHGYYDYSTGSDLGMRDLLEGKSKYDEGTGKWFDATWDTGEKYLGTYDTLLYQERSATYIKNHATKFLQGSDADYRPFFLWSAQHGIHSELDSQPEPPMSMLTAADKTYLKFLTSDEGPLADDGDDNHRTFFNMRKVTAAVLMSVDSSLRNLVSTLEDYDMLKDSVILVNSDNGGDTVYTKGHPGNNFPLRSAKFAYFEGGVRVPAFVYAPWVDGFETTYGGTEFTGLMHHVDLLPTFMHLAGSSISHDDFDIDGYNMWQAILGKEEGTRDELVLNMPRNVNWTPGERVTQEGVAIRMGHYKLLLNHIYDGWFSPDVGSADWVDASDMYSLPCMYNFYELGSDPSCTYSGYLFDVVSDPLEKHNLIGHDDQKDRISSMLSRVQELLSENDDPNYGKLVYEFYMNADEAGKATPAWEASNDFAVPWECDLLK